MGLREWILPMEKEFFTLFEEEISISIKAAKILRAHIADLKDFEKYAKELKALEKKSDEVVHDIYLELDRTFITPFDQRDIAELASTIDDIIDSIEDVAMRIHAYKIDRSDRFLIGFADLLVESTIELEKAIKLLRKKEMFKRIPQHIIEIHRLENHGDELLREAIVEVFKNENPILIIQLKECYELLEDATDQCEKVSHLIEDIIIRHG
jgi:predicted phosphate transport protein (TIGR00153 family)